MRLDIACFPEGSLRLRALRAGFAAMAARPAGDPRSLAFQAGLLDSLAAPVDPARRVYFTWKFLPWQRGFLYFFERLLQDAAGDPALTLPYWDWSLDLRVPSQYWGQGNPLYDPNRIATPQSTLDPAQTAIAELLAIPAFAAFGGEPDAGGALEVGPHDYVHRFVGHDMGGLATEGLDPLSFAHHAAVDRVWWLWSRDPTHADPLHDPAWAETRFQYYDAAGQPVTLSVREVLALPCGYAPGVERFDVTATDAPPLALDTSPVVVTSPALPDDLRRRMAAAGAGWLRVVGIARPESEPTTVRVFVDDPSAGASTPLDSASYVGSFTLQPTGGGTQAPGSLNLDVTRQLARLAGQDTLSVTLVPAGLDPSRPGIGPITIASLVLNVATP